MTLNLQTMSSYFMGNNFNPAYKTQLGEMFVGDSIELLNKLEDNSVNLVVTSPPFALQRKKDNTITLKSTLLES